MERDDTQYRTCVEVLHRQLRPALGCTEPIAVAYAAAVAKRTLDCPVERARVLVSGNVMKNAKSAAVPGTDGLKGIEAACAAGLVAGDPDQALEVITGITPVQQQEIRVLAESGAICTGLRPEAHLVDIQVEVWGGGHCAMARIADRHTRLVALHRDGVPVQESACGVEASSANEQEESLTIADIFTFAGCCHLSDVQDVLERQIEYNWSIAMEGMTGRWGAAIGRTLADTWGVQDVRNRAKVYAAAGSDARMSGCEMPVVINSGSGNQGITVSVPVITYAKEYQLPHEKLLRALVLSNLAAVRVKTLIGFLSAYCGAISAGCAAAAGIAFLMGGDEKLINHVLVNGLAILSGTICDGAKPSCAAKIASAVDAALMGYEMALAGREFAHGEGLVKKGVENTLACIGRLGREGMRETDKEILQMMMEQ